MEKASYKFSADFLRFLAISGVVMIHVANAVFGRPDFFGGLSWWFAILLNSLSRIAVPLFIVISGYFILNKNETFIESLKRTFNKLIIPLVFWFLIYNLWNFGNPTFRTINFSIITNLFTVNVLDLYFFLILIGLYIVSPIIRSFLESLNSKEKKQFTIFTLISGFIIFLTQYLFYLCSPQSSFLYWLPFTGYFVVGYYFSRFKNNNKFITIIIFSISLLVTIIGSYFYFYLHNKGNNLLASHGCLSYYSDSYLSINVILMTLCIFSLFINAKLKFNKLAEKLIYSIARCSLGIYVIHIFYLQILDSRFHFFDHISPAWFYIIIKWLVIFTLSYLTTFILIKIPFIKRVFGETK